MGERGREGEPVKWTGRVPIWKRVIEANPDHMMRDRWAEGEQSSGSHWPPRRQETPLARAWLRPYRKPTQVGRGNSPQVIERPSVKELGKLTPYLWKKGDPGTFLCSQRGGRGDTTLAQPTVYQKHRSLQTRKRTYRG